MKRPATRTFGILTSGGDCPGLNAAIRGVTKAAYWRYGMSIIGISHGYRGLIEGDARLLHPRDFDGILTRGGTILGTSREKPFKPDPGEKDSEAGSRKVEAIIENYHKLHLDCLVVLGGNGTHKTAYLLQQAGLNVIGLPKTIDNDIWGTDVTFGFHSAVDIATEAIDRLHSTAHAHNRVMVIEVMGHKAGWLALYAGIAGGGDIILIPEIPYDLAHIVHHLQTRQQRGKEFSIVVVAEGALSREESLMSKEERKKRRKKNRFPTKGYEVAHLIQEATGMETRVTVLGYLQRGGTPSPYDRLLATRFGTAAAELLYRGDYGKMVALRDGEVVAIPLGEVAEKLKTVPPDHPLIDTARAVGTCFGDGV
ncbi:6-phosphofructokinase [Spirochaeta thermophila]|uniref:ATP-dependent 6-phosphofructokinase n=1 Tax=Winmispira thermophila (strain ATCC 49972 / DSM 6192 / RI 19.B1) TaxID=665571 RepID=PFKA_WINT6|nr:ATP-dependent 6-phosphofructokinase [Spirochaeta thermophila]E0RTD9.1 RecName: Full=ATP-dependent 6-phosphofructokinase; Short=ATP-PFK; Short=Phosphofructokinase; AltName: Full=Phosphohexokinase [Spirochaeta thermophila DSM 6192]ADN01005.1 6-phosphofructokinase 3 [Spirochaeta thermophila DSM 6192]WAK75872.1 ATP-dependent 6-phosphofructokinase [Expression vector pTK93]